MSQIQTRMTKQRAIILEELRKLKTHPTADEMYGIVRKRLPNISLGTVYRNLDFLTENGEIRCLVTSGASKRFDGDLSAHQHVRCVHCGCVADVFQPVAPPSVNEIRVPGFSRVLTSRVEFDGICDSCASRPHTCSNAQYKA